jgi:hypothetical protein
MLRRYVLKILSRPVSRDLIATIALDSIGLLDTKVSLAPNSPKSQLVGFD